MTGQIWVEDAAFNIIHRQFGVQWIVSMKKREITFRSGNLQHTYWRHEPKSIFSSLSCSSAGKKFLLFATSHFPASVQGSGSLGCTKLCSPTDWQINGPVSLFCQFKIISFPVQKKTCSIFAIEVLANLQNIVRNLAEIAFLNELP